jgi:outer membrane protein TolC
MLIERLTVLEQKRASAVAMINSLLDRSPETLLVQMAEIKKGELRYALEELYRMAAAKYPGLKQQERMIDSSEYNVALAKKEFYPDFAVSFQYLQRPIMPEMWGLNFTLKVPLYFWRKQRPALEEAAAELAGAKQQHNSIKTQLFFRVKDQYLMATTAERLARLYEEGIIPQATLTLESSVASYQVGAVDFLTLLSNVMTVLTYELSYYEQLTTYQKSLAQLEPLVGVELAK